MICTGLYDRINFSSSIYIKEDGKNALVLSEDYRGNFFKKIVHDWGKRNICHYPGKIARF